MITVYTRTRGETSYQNIIKWLHLHQIPYQEKLFSEMTYEDFLHCLTLAENGFSDLVITSNQIGINRFERLEDLSVEEAVKKCLAYPANLRGTFMVDERELLVGYHKDDIRVFLPRVRHISQSMRWNVNKK